MTTVFAIFSMFTGIISLCLLIIIVLLETPILGICQHSYRFRNCNYVHTRKINIFYYYFACRDKYCIFLYLIKWLVKWTEWKFMFPVSSNKLQLQFGLVYQIYFSRVLPFWLLFLYMFQDFWFWFWGYGSCFMIFGSRIFIQFDQIH